MAGHLAVASRPATEIHYGAKLGVTVAPYPQDPTVNRPKHAHVEGFAVTLGPGSHLARS